MARPDLLSAAIRHIRDAELLASVAAPDRSLDQAYHLAGFGPECARKATLSRSTFDKAIGHGTTEASELSLEWALAHDPRAHRYRIDLAAWAGRYPALAKWNEGARYDRTGRRQAPEVAALLAEARAIVGATVAALWGDGALDARFMRDLDTW
jgi:hypothetical protein